MRFVMWLDSISEVTKEELEREGIKVWQVPEKEGKNHYIPPDKDFYVEIKTLEQAVELAKKYKADFVISQDGETAFFFNGYYEG